MVNEVTGYIFVVQFINSENVLLYYNIIFISKQLHDIK